MTRSARLDAPGVLHHYHDQRDGMYAIKPQGFDLVEVARRPAEIFAVDVQDIYSRQKHPVKVKARSLFCYWASNELGISHTELAKRIGIRSPGVGYSVERGKRIAQEKGYQLLADRTLREQLIILPMSLHATMPNKTFEPLAALWFGFALS